MFKVPYIVLSIGACLMGYSIAHTDVVVGGQIVTAALVFGIGAILTVAGFAELIEEEDESEQDGELS